MGAGETLSIGAVALQSLGKVLYGTFLVSDSTPLFVLVSISLTAVVFLVCVRFRLPRQGRTLLVSANVWTAVSFLSIFFALKHLPPALFACIEIGSSLLMAIALTAVQTRVWPRMIRLLACGGILAGCTLLSWAEVMAAVSERTGALVWMAILASTMTGVASAVSASIFRKLALSGWTPSSVLAHRFYLTIGIAVVWLGLESPAVPLPDAGSLALMAVVGAVGVLVPLLMLQMALARVDALTVMICVAAQPILSFLIAVPSPAYEWSTLTLVGVVIVTAFVGLDIAGQRTGVPQSSPVAAKT